MNCFSKGLRTTAWSFYAAVATAVNINAQVVINEFHYNPLDHTSREEFIELYNTNVTPVDLSGWSLRDAVDYTFPPGTIIPANSYAVVAQDPATLLAVYGVSALGPWNGALSGDGEDIELFDNADVRRDRVNYGVHFPWPTSPDGAGPSAELIHPSLDNDLGGSWRASGGDAGGTTGAPPTPGAQNSVYALPSAIPPHIRQVEHAPEQPLPGEAVTITAKITDPDGIGPVTLSYQAVDPGAYIALTDPAYETIWTTVAMADDGTNGDALAGDSIYTAVLPAALQTNRRLMRYRIAFEDTLGNDQTVPYADDEQPNFAYFCYAGVPAWQGAVEPGTTPVIDFGTNVMRRLPAVHLISKNEDVEQATWGGYGGDEYLWTGALVYDGKVYDHIHYRARGGGWRYAMVKNMWKFDFSRGHNLQMRDDYGRKYDTQWRKLNLGACIQQNWFEHRGEQGMFESVGSRLFNLSGVPSFKTSFLQFRIIDDTDETAADQYEGDFWGLYLALEQLDGRFLDEHALPDGNFYKMESWTGELNNLGPYGPTDKSDLQYILDNYNSASDDWWEANWNLKDYYSYQTIVQAMHHYDINDGKNYFYYHNPETGLWSVIPWDLDLTWADNMWRRDWGGMNPLAAGILDASSTGGDYSNLTLPGSTRTTFRRDFRNRIRDIRDLLFNTEQAGQLIDEKASLLRDAGVSPSFLDADRAMWDYNPRMTASWQADIGKFYQWPQEPEVSKDFEGCVQLMKNYVDERSAILDALAADPDIPATPSISYVGTTGYPLNGLSFQCSSFNDPQGGGTFGAMQWRAGEVLDASAPAYDPSGEPPFEIETKWESGELATFNNTLSIPANALKVGHAYRVRVRMKDNTGRWSHWSAPVQFICGESSSAGSMTSYLRISELMYDPPAGSDFEFIELQNTSTNLTLDIAGAAFTSGIDFNFPNGITIAPNGYLLLIGTTNEAMFRAHYQLTTNTTIAGSYTGSLSNGGEEIKLKTAPGGTEIAAFDYDNSRHWPLAAAGAGHSLVPVSISGQATGALDYPGNWQASTYIGGSPGTADPEPPQASLMLNEITAHTDYYNPSNPEYDSDDWIELFNATGASINLTGWYLSDDPADPSKWACPSVELPAGGYIVFHEVADFHNPITEGFGIDKAGEQVMLSYLPGNPDDRVVDAVGFKGQENARSFSRHGDYWYICEQTEDAVNDTPLGGLRIGEVMYCPAPMGTNDNTRDEFIEIYNPTTSGVTMQTVDEAWRIEGGVDYTFPDNTEVLAGSMLLVVGFDPADSATSNAFVAAYGITNSVPMFGPWSGKLGNRSERVALERPQAPDFVGDDYSWVVEDEIVYGNQHPWPSGAAGNGSSLARLLFSHSGLDPENWQVAAPSPGSSVPSPLTDQDGDGVSDFDEWISGTDPYDPGSVFRIQSFDGSELLWSAVPGRTYSVYWTESLDIPFIAIATDLNYPQSNFIDSAHVTNNSGFYILKVDN